MNLAYQFERQTPDLEHDRFILIGSASGATKHLRSTVSAAIFWVKPQTTALVVTTIGRLSPVIAKLDVLLALVAVIALGVAVGA
ncbi:MAG: hypothetical protein JO235_24485 [Chroococcidiopsidaceae cyanobacterium CP_BM_RX_35]|nr:hypothetical protein [Chroococcidiopsidaceae cyanobacterium CP_BM_RX_35]